MQTLEAYLKDYSGYHRTHGNRTLHFIAIPVIVMTLLGLLHQVPIVSFVTAATLLWVVANLFYLKLNVRLGAGMLFSTAALYALGTQLSSTVLWILFILGWVLQFIGHYGYEKKSPAFLRNLVHILVGPLYVQLELLKSFSAKRS